MTVENTHSQMHHTDSLARAARRAFTATAVAAVPGHGLRPGGVHPHLHHEGAGPLAVHAADAGRGLLDDRFLRALQHAGARAHRLADEAPAGCGHGAANEADGSFDRILPPFGRLVERDRAAPLDRRAGLPGRLRADPLVRWAGRSGTELFPQVDSGQFVLRFRAPPGSQYELTRRTAVKILDVIDKETRGKVAISMGYVGLAATNTSTNNMLLFMRGPDDGELRVRLTEGQRRAAGRPARAAPQGGAGSDRPLAARDASRRADCRPSRPPRRAKLFLLGFEPGDIVSEVMSLGSPMPIEVVVAGPNRDDVARPCPENPRRDEEDPHPPRRAALPAARLSGRTRRHRPPAGRAERRDRQGRDRLRCWWARPPAATSPRITGATPPAASTTRCRSRCPTPRMDHPEQIQTLPLQKVSLDIEPDDPRRGQGPARHRPRPGRPQLDAAVLEHHRQRRRGRPGPGRAPHRAGDRRRRRPAARRARAASAARSHPWKRCSAPSFLGLVLSVVVILVMLTGYFQSPRMGLVSIGAVPGVVCGVAVILLATGTTLNIESFMGSIMCIGVSVANSVMLTTFMGDYWRSGMTPLEAAVKGAKDRLRPGAR